MTISLFYEGIPREVPADQVNMGHLFNKSSLTLPEINLLRAQNELIQISDPKRYSLTGELNREDIWWVRKITPKNSLEDAMNTPTIYWKSKGMDGTFERFDAIENLTPVRFRQGEGFSIEIPAVLLQTERAEP